MRKILLGATVAAGLLLAAPSPARAEVTGNQLHEMCRSARGQGFCLAYVTATAEMAEMLTIDDPATFVAWCRPDGVTNNQLMDAVARDLRAHPEDRHTPALILVMVSLRTNFPCN